MICFEHIRCKVIYSVVILAIGFSGDEKYKISAILFTVGIILFSFSLYLYSITYTVAFAMVTPFGGLSFLAGWLMMVVKAVMSKE